MTATIDRGTRRSPALAPQDTRSRASAPRTAPRDRRIAALVVTATLLAAAAEAPVLRIFGPAGLRLVALVVPAAALAAAGTRSWLRRRAGDPGSPLPAIGGFVAGLVVGALPGMLLAPADPFGPAGLVPRLREAVTDGWYRLLSVPVPVPFSRSFTDLPFLAGAALAAVIALAALGRRPALAALPAVLGFGGLLVLGANGPVAGTVLAGAFALAVLLFLTAAAPPAGRRAAGGGLLAGAAVVAVAALAVAMANPGPPYDPRASLRVPLNVTVLQDPLALLPARMETPNAPVLTAQLSGSLLSHSPYWVLLTYEGYDGGGWQAAASARPAATGSRVPGTSGSGGARVTVAQPATLLPHPADVLGTGEEDFGYDPGAELLASPSPVRRYSLSVSVPEPTQTQLTTAALPSTVPAVLTRTPSCTPAALRSLASQVSAAVSAPEERAARLQQLLSSAPFRYDKSAAPGEGCGSINNMLSVRKGTSAQFATAFVLAARLLGIPARVAVGYSPGQISGSTETVTDADAYAWPQVDLEGVGWVDFFPTPKAGSSGHTPARKKLPTPQKLKVKQPVSNPVGTPRLVPPVPSAGHGLTAAERVLLALAAVMALVLGWLAAVWLWSARRLRRRRRAAEPAARVLGAWDEFLIPLGQAGRTIRGRSARAVARDAAAVVPDQAHEVRQLATLAERALYDEISERDADAAWQLSDRARGSAAAAASRRMRLRRAFIPPRVSR